MAANKKSSKPSSERTAQAARSERNKKRRVERNKRAKGLGKKAPWYVRAKLGNRLRRLNNRVTEVAPDRRKDMIDRISEIERALAT